ncbi:hypothetical protein AWB80_03607 [Caballeronia pedi]|uniref:Uncharacterized protein n=1 Tax=Caballeronia pedi TaxID=1777141 RepID=A0A158BKC2_9BURK|nr:hypothetical protein [Caballeronia pedi]SAK69777.1 hypothetical protein AWB80_03607 [Caballeronia pedi]
MAGRSDRTNGAWSKLFFGLLKSFIAAIAGYFLHSLVDHRQDQVKRVDSQLNVVYRPLRAELLENTRTWEIFHKAHFPDRLVFFDGGVRTVDDIKVWRNYIQTTAQRSNERMSDLISNKVALLVDGRIPNVFAIVIAHTENYKVTIAGWEKSTPDKPAFFTASANTSGVNFPSLDDLQPCVDKQIEILEKTQHELNNPMKGLFDTVPETVPAVCDARR